MRCPQYDFHVHTKYLGCANATMEVLAIVRECERLGVTTLGITDHVNSRDDLRLHVPIRQDIEGLDDTELEIYFGVELNFTGYDEEFVYSREIAEEYGFQFAIGGIHSTYVEEYDLGTIVDIQHKHHIKTCLDPLVEVLVHPYWFGSREFEDHGWPWFDSMKAIPEHYVRELGQVARETGTAIEINAMANLTNPKFSASYVEQYVDFLSVLAEEGAVFSLGSDAHDIHELATIQDIWQVVKRLGLSQDRIWRPQGKPLIGAS